MEPAVSRPRRLRALAARAFPELIPPLTPFGRLAVTHLLMLSGDAFMTVALAGSLFFSISPSAARGKVALYLVLTMAPFAVVAPALGPLLDRSRGARRALMAASAGVRAVLCLLMARDLHSLLLFPEAFGVLVASKLYLVAKAAFVPTTVEAGPALVRANSRLALIAAAAGLVAGLPAAAILKIPALGAAWVLRVDTVVFALAGVSASRLGRPAGRRARSRPDRSAVPRADDFYEEEAPTLEEEPVWSHRVTFALAEVAASATAMAVLRLVVGFVTFLMAFELRRRHAAAWWFGVVLAASIAGSLLATLVAPTARRWVREERILASSLLVVAAAAGGAWYLGGRLGDVLLTAAVGLGAGAAKLAFDSLVQRDVPEAARGRAFSRFETRFQLSWVVGGLIPVAAALSDRAGELAVALLCALSAVAYLAGWGGIGRHRPAASPGAHPAVP